MSSVDQRNGQDRIRSIDAELLFQHLRSGRDTVIVDVRTSQEFRGPAGRIPGARSIPSEQLVARSAELEANRALPVVVVSASGDSARIAALELELVGFTEVCSLDGGMRRWLALDLPTERVQTTDVKLQMKSA